MNLLALPLSIISAALFAILPYSYVSRYQPYGFLMLLFVGLLVGIQVAGLILGVPLAIVSLLITMLLARITQGSPPKAVSRLSVSVYVAVGAVLFQLLLVAVRIIKDPSDLLVRVNLSAVLIAAGFLWLAVILRTAAKAKIGTSYPPAIPQG